jgi:hypothetical protein
VLAATLALAACGETTNNSQKSQSDQLSQLSQNTSNADSATFEATWQASSAAGKMTTITWAQQSPNSLFKVDNTLILTQGPTTYFCSSATLCVKESVGTPLTALQDLYDGKIFKDSISSYTNDAALQAAGVSLTFHDATYAGVKSSCADIDVKGNTATWCVASDSGVITYWSGDGASYELTSYTATPPASDFELPPNAKVVGVP